MLSARTPSRMSGSTASKAKRFPPSSTKAASGVWSVGTSWSPSATPHQKDTTTAKGTTTDSTALDAEGATDPSTSQKKLPGMFVFHILKHLLSISLSSKTFPIKIISSTERILC